MLPFQDGPEVEISLDEDDERETGSNPDQRPQEDVLDSEEDEEAVLHLQQEQEEQMPIHLVGFWAAFSFLTFLCILFALFISYYPTLPKPPHT